jgi:predicted Zn-dependent protease
MANGTEAKKPWGRQKYIAEHVDSITLIGGAIIVQKRQPRDVRSAIEFADVYVSRCPPTSARYLRLAEFILRHNGPLDQAARQAVSSGDPTSAALSILMRVLQRQEQLDEAAEAAGKATEEWPDQPNLWRTLARIQRRRGLPGAAAEALRTVAALQPKDALVQRKLSMVLEESDDLRGAHASAIKAAELVVEHPAQPELARRAEVLGSRLGEAPW